MIWGIIIGLVLGVLFKPQIDAGIRKAVRYIEDKRRGGGDY